MARTDAATAWAMIAELQAKIAAAPHDYYCEHPEGENCTCWKSASASDRADR